MKNATTRPTARPSAPRRAMDTHLASGSDLMLTQCLRRLDAGPSTSSTRRAVAEAIGELTRSLIATVLDAVHDLTESSRQ